MSTIFTLRVNNLSSPLVLRSLPSSGDQALNPLPNLPCSLVLLPLPPARGLELEEARGSPPVLPEDRLAVLVAFCHEWSTVAQIRGNLGHGADGPRQGLIATDQGLDSFLPFPQVLGCLPF